MSDTSSSRTQKTKNGKSMSDSPQGKNSDHVFVRKSLHVSKDSSGKEKSQRKPKKSKVKHSTQKKVSQEWKSLEKIDEQLAEIYKNQDGSLPDMRHFQKRERKKLLRALFFLLFSGVFLAAVAWGGFFVFNPEARFSQEQIILSISGEEKVTVGQDVVYRVRYRNAQQTPLAKTRLHIRYPAGFVFLDSSLPPTNDTQDEWTLGSVGEGDSGFIDIKGKLFGNLGEKQSFRVFLNYLPGNFSSEFQEVAMLNVEMNTSPVALAVEAPGEVTPGMEVPIVVTITPENGTLEHMRLVLDGGGTFIKKTGEPSSDEFEELQWTFDRIDKPTTIHITGVLSLEEGDEASGVDVRLIGWSNAERKGEGYTYAQAQYMPVMLKTALEASVVVNGTTKQLVVQPGDVLRGIVVVRNTGDATLQDARVRMLLEGPSHAQKSLFQWEAFEDPLNGSILGEQIDARTRRGIVIWDSRQIPGLHELAPGEEQQVEFSLPVKTKDDTDLTLFETAKATLLVEVQYTLGYEKQVVNGVPLAITINSDLSVDIQDDIVRTKNDNDLHTITWLLNNTFHDLEHIELVADVYGKTAWSEDVLVVPAGEVQYNAEKKQVTWMIEKMPKTIDVLAFQFGLLREERNPSQTQLVSKVRVKAKDVVTGEEILLVGDEVLLKE